MKLQNKANSKFYYLYSESTTEVSNELEAAQSAFGVENTGTLITNIPANKIVVPRFRSIPFGRDLENEIQNRGSQLINSY